VKGQGEGKGLTGKWKNQSHPDPKEGGAGEALNSIVD
jgi:hypothetical protein